MFTYSEIFFKLIYRSIVRMTAILPSFPSQASHTAADRERAIQCTCVFIYALTQQPSGILSSTHNSLVQNRDPRCQHHSLRSLRSEVASQLAKFTNINSGKQPNKTAIFTDLHNFLKLCLVLWLHAHNRRGKY